MEVDFPVVYSNLKSRAYEGKSFLLDLPYEIIFMIASFCGISRYQLAATCSSLLFLFDFFKVQVPQFMKSKRDWLLISEGNYEELIRNSFDVDLSLNEHIFANRTFNNPDYVWYTIKSGKNFTGRMILRNPNANRFVVKYLRSKFDKNTHLINDSIFPLYIFSSNVEIISCIICDYFEDFKKLYDSEEKTETFIRGTIYIMAIYAIDYQAEKCLSFLIARHSKMFVNNAFLISKCIVYASDNNCDTLVKLIPKNWKKNEVLEYLTNEFYDALGYLPIERLKKFGYDIIDIVITECI